MVAPPRPSLPRAVCFPLPRPFIVHARDMLHKGALVLVDGSDCDWHMDADTPISEIFAARMQPPRNGEEYMGLLKFQLHELAAVRAKDPAFSPSAARCPSAPDARCRHLARARAARLLAMD